MPYRVRGTVVQVQRSGRWRMLKKHRSHAKAMAHMRALKANVKHGKKRAR